MSKLVSILLLASCLTMTRLTAATITTSVSCETSGVTVEAPNSCTIPGGVESGASSATAAFAWSITANLLTLDSSLSAAVVSTPWWSELAAASSSVSSVVNVLVPKNGDLLLPAAGLTGTGGDGGASFLSFDLDISQNGNILAAAYCWVTCEMNENGPIAISMGIVSFTETASASATSVLGAAKADANMADTFSFLDPNGAPMLGISDPPPQAQDTAPEPNPLALGLLSLVVLAVWDLRADQQDCARLAGLLGRR